MVPHLGIRTKHNVLGYWIFFFNVVAGHPPPELGLRYRHAPFPPAAYGGQGSQKGPTAKGAADVASAKRTGPSATDVGHIHTSRAPGDLRGLLIHSFSFTLKPLQAEEELPYIYIFILFFAF